MLVSLAWRGRGRVARNGVGSRWHDHGGIRVSCGDVTIDSLLIVRAVSRERGNRVHDLVEQGADLRGVINVTCAQRGGEDAAGVGIHTDVQLAPGAACPCSMLLKQSFP